MRELIGKLPTKDPGVTQEIYLSELVRCRECQMTAPMGIEVIAVKRDGPSRKVLNHSYYCRAHGHDYEWPYKACRFVPELRNERWTVRLFF